MKFFKSEHAESFNAFHGSLISITKANEMLERGGRVVFADTPKCTHPKEKVRMHYKKLTDVGGVYKNFECECGARVQPKEFEEVK